LVVEGTGVVVAIGESNATTESLFVATIPDLAVTTASPFADEYIDV
jgi:hypothetical protein